MSEEQNRQIEQAVSGDMLRFGANREIRRLKEYLYEGEEVFAIVTGGRTGNRGRGIIVATSERVLFIWDGWIQRETQDFPYETISSVEFKVGVFFGAFTMFGKGDEVSYSYVGRFRGQAFTKKVRSLIASSVRNPSFRGNPDGNMNPAPATQSVPVVPAPAEPTHAEKVAKQIEELKRLLDEGYITEADYEAKKQELLNRM